MNTILKPAAAAIALLAATGTAHAVTVIGAKKIVVTNAIPTWLQVGELLAVEFGTGINVALASNGGTATASSEFVPSSGAGLANDGSINTDYYSAPGIFHSGSDLAGEFLQITFAAATDLSSLTIYGRSDNGEGVRDNYNVEIYDVSNTLIYTGGLNSTALSGGPVSVNFDAPGTVPEPATWATMLAGFGGIGFAMRKGNDRRKNKETVRVRFA